MLTNSLSATGKRPLADRARLEKPRITSAFLIALSLFITCRYSCFPTTPSSGSSLSTAHVDPPTSRSLRPLLQIAKFDKPFFRHRGNPTSPSDTPADFNLHRESRQAAKSSRRFRHHPKTLYSVRPSYRTNSSDLQSIHANSHHRSEQFPIDYSTEIRSTRHPSRNGQTCSIECHSQRGSQARSRISQRDRWSRRALHHFKNGGSAMSYRRSGTTRFESSNCRCRHPYPTRSR